LGVDYLRSCYSSRFSIDANGAVTIPSRFYRPPADVGFLTEPSYIRSAIWLDAWERFDGIGDILGDYSYDTGSRDFVVLGDRRGTRKVQTGCEGALALVPGSIGFPLGCLGARPTTVNVRWNGGSFYNTVNFDLYVIGTNIFPFGMTPIGELKWHYYFDDGSSRLDMTVTISSSEVLLEITLIPFFDPPFFARVRWPFVAGQVLYDFRPAEVDLPWENDPLGDTAQWYLVIS